MINLLYCKPNSLKPTSTKPSNSSAPTQRHVQNPDRPANHIYLQLVKKHHCPKSTESTPRTLTELKIYWQLLDWEKHPILIFYEEAKPQDFSQTFLDSLTRFDATICLIADSPHPTIPTFSPQDPHLIQSIMNWLQRTVLES
ncbi:hypothetical protein [Microcoleus anatoxicus]|uniref:NACHT C-terminal alpha/beta 1 domain-containing protein n=1 Tax=Microcoleus anatoxicus TaxID=2705319 RepID=UPI0030C8E66B